MYRMYMYMYRTMNKSNLNYKCSCTVFYRTYCTKSNASTVIVLLQAYKLL